MSEDHRVLVDVRQEQGSVFLALDSGEVLELAPQSVPDNLPPIGESISSPLLAEIRLAAERKLAARALFAHLDWGRTLTAFSKFLTVSAQMFSRA